MDTTGIRARHDYTLRTVPRGGAVRLLDQLEGLRGSTFPELAVSIYVSAGSGWGAAADAARELAHAAALDPAQRAAVARELPRLRRALEGEWRHVEAVAAFGAGRMRVVVGLPEPVPARISVAREADLGPLDEQLDRYPPALVAVLDKVGARIFAAVLDRVSLVRAAAGLPVHHHRQGETSAEQWQRRQEGNAEHNVAQVALLLSRLAHAHPGRYRAIRVAAPDEAASLLMAHLPPDLRRLAVRESGLATYATTGEIAAVLRRVPPAPPEPAGAPGG